MLDTGAAEEMNLLATEQRLFAAAGTADVVRAALTDAVIAERIEAFVARFSRFQDLLGDKLLPLVLRLSGDGVQPMIGNLDRAERYGWLDSADAWLRVRKLGNRMVHEYVTGQAELSAALEAIRSAVPSLSGLYSSLHAFAAARLLPPGKPNDLS